MTEDKFDGFFAALRRAGLVMRSNLYRGLASRLRREVATSREQLRKLTTALDLSGGLVEKLEKQEFAVGFISGLEFAVETAEKLADSCDAKEGEGTSQEERECAAELADDLQRLGEDLAGVLASEELVSRGFKAERDELREELAVVRRGHASIISQLELGLRELYVCFDDLGHTARLSLCKKLLRLAEDEKERSAGRQ